MLISGRSYHVLAVASRDLRMITLKPAGEPKDNSGSPSRLVLRYQLFASCNCVCRFDIRQAGQFDDHGSAVWRVCWNITGTILASSGDDGCVKLWKANYMDNWKCVSTLRADGQSIDSGNSNSSVAVTALGKSGFTKLSMVSSQANWH